MSRVNYQVSPDVMITSIYQSLTKSEQKVADVVQNQLKEAVYWSVSDLAEHAEVGETTVIRFCRKLGYKGYQDFKLAVAQHGTETNKQEYGEVHESDSVFVLSQKVTAENSQTLQNTLSLVNPLVMEEAAQQIIRANKLYTFGVGASGVIAQLTQYSFMRLGFHAETASDSHVIAMNCALAKPGDVVIGISTSGSTKDLVDAIEIAKANGAYIICITNHIKSPITKFGDVVLLTSAKESPLHGGAFSSLISQMHVLDMITRYIELQRKEKSREALQKTAQAVSDKLY
ncbi:MULTISPECIES: MurR/RpiR family transcriptional regulator [Sutcliffiella]|uniref:Transcriptional regulator n=1 Tax=Sutcliffiella cohnii TaxID=33932 RepID=A0A223KN35_9BACI|nr:MULTISPECIES: MurR/RpiR family transcriptional regulator [Sutcliffiella]AST90859.1 transcriptional regulator [Sutcliffiella cohnii]WBL16643.1 MurR/RpiR family transcriptional regulator [Sutcliffiella sp. NC1]